ncbi:MAG TPA: DUF1194 domain-containing protein [Micropepsaceae bacterium]|nr:DUF1194 domain-containing protein [Micropepsaceae bacterium]
MKIARNVDTRALAFVAGAIWLLFNCCSPAAAAEAVDLKLVLATDVSGSINGDELWLERTGTAQAFLDPDVIKAIQNGALGRIAVSMLDFSSPGFGKTVIDWRIIRDRPSAAAFARTILTLPRTPGDRTSISNALELGAALIRSSDKNIFATRKVIDVMGDGPNNIGKPMEQTRDLVTKQAVVVNGLPVMDERANGYFPNLDRYYQACVAGGRGAFIIVVRSYRDFAPAMRRKLILEIAQNEIPKRQALEDFAHKNLLWHIASTKPPPVRAPVLLRPVRNEFSNHCDVADAPVATGAR